MEEDESLDGVVAEEDALLDEVEVEEVGKLVEVVDMLVVDEKVVSTGKVLTANEIGALL